MTRAMRQPARVRVSPELVVGHIVGLRPFRRTGFRVDVERLGDTVVVHNYGHGGGGVSLSWGTAELAAALVQDAGLAGDAAVLGCGVVGLTAARVLQERGMRVTIYARDLPPETTSNVAGASWAPFTVFDPECLTTAFAGQFRRAAAAAYARFQTLIGTRYGVTWRDGYVLSDGQPTGFAARTVEDELVADIRPRPRQLVAGEHPFGHLTATVIDTLHIDPRVFLDALVADVCAAGGTIVRREVKDRAEIASLPQRLVVNCTGLGAGRLFDDRDVLPIKGQLAVLAAQPGVDYLINGPGELYMMPRRDNIILGGTHERGVWSLEPDPDHARRIVEGHRRLFEETFG